MKKTMMAVMVAALMACAGCGVTVDNVKNGKLSGHEQTTVGKAFDAYFNNTVWELKETDNGTQFVEFRGTFRADITPGWADGTIMFAKGSPVRAQFLIKEKNFSLSCMEVAVTVAGKDEDTRSIVALALAARGIKEGPWIPNEQIRDVMVDAIYNGGAQ